MRLYHEGCLGRCIQEDDLEARIPEHLKLKTILRVKGNTVIQASFTLWKLRNMVRKAILLFCIMCILPLSCSKQRQTIKDNPKGKIISLVPSLTVTCYFLGLDKEVIGITDFDKDPLEWVKTKRSVGGGLNPNLEYIASLQPDLILLSTYQRGFEPKLTALGIRVLVLKQDNINDVFAAIDSISLLTKCSTRASVLKDSLAYFMKANVKPRARKPLVLIVVGRAEGSLSNIFVAEYKGFLEELVYLAGGEPVFKGKPHPSGPISREGLLNLNPDIIIEIKPSDEENIKEKDMAKDDWSKAVDIKAVKSNQVYILQKPYVGIPSPRIGQTLLDFVHIIDEWEKAQGASG